MRKIIKNLIVILSFLVMANPVFAQKVEKLAVFPVDVPVQGTSITLYPNVLQLISSDIVNTLSKSSYLNVIDLSSSESLIESAGLKKKYNKLLYDYKTTYSINNDTSALIAKKMGANKILFVSGGFDIQSQLMDRGLLYKLDIPTGQPLIPHYRLNILLTLLDPESGIIIWEDTYSKNFKASNFPLPSQYFSENVVSTEKIKKFSYELAQKVNLKMENTFASSQYTEVNSNIVSTKDNITTEDIQPTDGPMTKDGHFYSTNYEYPLSKRMNNYKNWIKQKVLS
ncbi:MAG TPA: hypothetical protein DDX14_05750, partial [Cyanobacteria bacterium UBA9579]|nr:hypothetical protein [Cyanobacteria bacterium UBA9579]